MGQLAVPLMIAQTVVSTIGSYRQAQAEKGQAKYNAAVARNNQIVQNQLSERNLQLAEDARKRGETEEYKQRLRTKALAGDQRSSLAAGGVDVGFGSSVDLIGDTFEIGELDALTVRDNAEREAYGYEQNAHGNRVQAMNYGSQSNMYRSQASNISPFMRAGTALLNGVSTTASYYNKMRSNPQDTS